MTDLKGKTVFVGLSGGVDSSVTAALLQKAGATIYGVFIQGWYPPYLSCTWKEDRADAMRVAAHLRIPFLTLDASREYKQFVIDYLLREYKEGRTPNPDIMCNREVKFGAFYEYAMQHGADYVATGHYAQSIDGQLIRGRDTEKDQSYFLWALKKAQLSSILFPLGGLAKKDVRVLADRFALPTATKKDSQGICFLGSVSMDEFLLHEFNVSKGKAYSPSGEYVGEHDGALLHTIGEKVALESKEAGPWYVVSKDIEKNTLVVSHIVSKPDTTQSFGLSSTNYFREIDTARTYTAQYRYHGPRIEVTLTENGSLCTPVIPLTETLSSGQSLVIYDEDTVVGGGIIEA